MDNAGNGLAPDIAGVTFLGRVRADATSPVIPIKIVTQDGLNDNDSGFVDLSSTSMFAKDAGDDLTIDTSATGPRKAGDVNLNVFSNDVAANFIHQLNILAGNASNAILAGNVLLNGNISVDDDAAGVASLFKLTGNGNVVLKNNINIDTEQGGTNGVAGGAVDFGTFVVTGDNLRGRDLTIDTSTTGTGPAAKGGDVLLANFDDVDGAGTANTFVNRVMINTGSTISTPGRLQLTGEKILLDDDGAGTSALFQLAGGGNVIVVAQSATIDTEQPDVADAVGGAIDLGSGKIDGQGINRQLSLIASGNLLGGAISYGEVTQDGVNGGGQYLGAFTAETHGVGVSLSLNKNITVDNNSANPVDELDESVAGIKLIADQLPITANFTVMGKGKITATADANSPTAITLGTNNILKTDSGQISGEILKFNGTEFTALMNSEAKGNLKPPIVGGDGAAEIQFKAIDSNVALKNLVVEIDWRGGTGVLTPPTLPSLLIPPPTDAASRYVDFAINGVNDVTFVHQYDRENRPDPSFVSGGFVHVLVHITGLIQNASVSTTLADTLALSVNKGATQLLSFDPTGSIQVIIDVPFVGFVGDNAIPAPEPLPVRVESAPIAQANVDVSQPIEVPTTLVLTSTAGTAASGEERYYELHVVSFDKDGKLDDTKVIIRLDDKDFKAIYPFNPSKLPALFGRLPADRYRIYLFEDGAKRLILDFTIQQGQPIETPDFQDSNVNGGNTVTNPFGDTPDAPRHPPLARTTARCPLPPRRQKMAQASTACR